MKHFLTILLILLMGSGVFATGLGNTNLHITDSIVTLVGNISQDLLSNINHLKNNGSTSVDLKWEVIQFDVPSAWDVGFCDKSQCYTINGNSTNAFSLAAGDSSIMDLQVNHNNSIGSGTVRIAVYPAGGSINDGITITHYITVAVGIKNAVAINFTMFPNPVKDYLNINFTRKGYQHIEIYNILGNKILVKDIANADYIRIPFSNYQRGRYVIMYRSENGKVITKSITKE